MTRNISEGEILKNPIHLVSDSLNLKFNGVAMDINMPVILASNQQDKIKL